MLKVQCEHLLLCIGGISHRLSMCSHQVASCIACGGRLVGCRLQFSGEIGIDMCHVILLDGDAGAIRIISHVIEVFIIAVQHMCIAGFRKPCTHSVRLAINQLEVIYIVYCSYIRRLKVSEGKDTDGIPRLEHSGVTIFSGTSSRITDRQFIRYFKSGEAAHSCPDSKRRANVVHLRFSVTDVFNLYLACTA